MLAPAGSTPSRLLTRWLPLASSLLLAGLSACADDGPTPSSRIDQLDSSFVRPDGAGDEEEDAQLDAPADVEDAEDDANDAPSDGGDVAETDGDGLDDGSGDADAGPVGAIDLGEGRTVAGCETVSVSPSADFALSDPRWSFDGYPALALERGDDGAITFRAPVTNRATAITIRLDAAGPEGAEFGEVVFHVEPAASDDESLAAGMAWDCAPFPTGVASGDPAAESVLLWTRVTADEDTELSWTLATDPFLEDVVAEGSALATAARDYTVQVEATGLSAGTTYYYRFATPTGEPSALGRTRTTPAEDATSVRLASVSCASVFSGYFNAYARLADRDDLALIVHLGDYIYDFVDEDEEVRLPAEYPIDPGSEAEWRERHRYYLADPDLRAARAAHPWVVLWDNHDIERALADADQRTIEVFHENVPIRTVDAEDPRVIWRTIRLGALADLTIVDIYAHHLDDESLMGDDQWAFLEGEARGRTAAWHIFGNQELVTRLSGPEDFGLGDLSDWDEVEGERERFFSLLGERDDNVVLSGDLHFTVAVDLVLDPVGEPPYDPASGEGSVGVELLAGSISRGNFDETLCSGLCPQTILNLIAGIRGQLLDRNPHLRDFEPIQHGYALLDIDAERVEAQMWFTPIREVTDEQTQGLNLVVQRGANRWARE